MHNFHIEVVISGQLLRFVSRFKTSQQHRRGYSGTLNHRSPVGHPRVHDNEFRGIRTNRIACEWIKSDRKSQLIAMNSL